MIRPLTTLDMLVVDIFQVFTVLFSLSTNDLLLPVAAQTTSL